VRKRLDFKRAVPPELITRCIDIALQAPTGSNAQGWHFLVVTDPALRRGLADLYRKAFELYLNTPGIRPTYEDSDPRHQQMPRVVDSASYLAEHLHEAPVHVIPCIEGRIEQRACSHKRPCTARSCRPPGRSCWPPARAGWGRRGPPCTSCTSRKPPRCSASPRRSRRRRCCRSRTSRGSDFKPARRPAVAPAHPLGALGTAPLDSRGRPRRAPRRASEHTAIVTIDRPERANALDPPTLLALASAWRELAADDDVRWRRA
jgi:nitroreductase